MSYINIHISRLDELVSDESGLRLKERLLEQEKELLKTQNEWLTQELESKSDQLIQLKKERSSTVGELESLISTKEEEVQYIQTYLRIETPVIHLTVFKGSSVIYLIGTNWKWSVCTVFLLSPPVTSLQ